MYPTLKLIPHSVHEVRVPVPVPPGKYHWMVSETCSSRLYQCQNNNPNKRTKSRFSPKVVFLNHINGKYYDTKDD